MRNPVMTKSEAKPAIAAVNELFSKSPDGLGEIVRAVMQEMLEAEMTDALGAEKGERTAARLGYAPAITAAPSSPGWASSSCACRRTETGGSRPNSSNAISAPSRRSWRRWPRWEPALGLDPRVQGVSTRKVKAITEELCGHAFSASAISAINKRLDESLDAFAKRPLAEPFPYLILDAGYEKVREGGVVMSQAADRHRNRLGRAPPDPGGRNGQPGKPLIPEGLPARAAPARPQRRRVRRRRRSRRPSRSRPGGACRSRLSTLLHPLPPQRPRPSAAQGRRRLPAGIALALRSAFDRGGPPGPRRMHRQMGRPISQARRLGRGNHRGDAHRLQAPATAP